MVQIDHDLGKPADDTTYPLFLGAPGAVVEVLVPWTKHYPAKGAVDMIGRDRQPGSSRAKYYWLAKATYKEEKQANRTKHMVV